MWRAGRWQDPEAGNPWGGAGSASSSVGRAGALGDAQIASLAKQKQCSATKHKTDGLSPVTGVEAAEPGV